jgi:hypothetical protein
LKRDESVDEGDDDGHSLAEFLSQPSPGREREKGQEAKREGKRGRQDTPTFKLTQRADFSEGEGEWNEEEEEALKPRRPIKGFSSPLPPSSSSVFPFGAAAASPTFYFRVFPLPSAPH